jgi:DNA polymerase-3 subunit alpha
MESIPDFISAKQGQRSITYLDPCLKPILEKTHGVIVYQEQVFEIARQFAGFTYGQADILRKAVGKKIKTLLDEQREKFINGAVANGKDRATAKKAWDFIEPFAQYGFNKSHAACYAMIAYQTAYLKSNYPVEFMASLLTSDEGDVDRVAILVEECHRMGIEVLPPDINESFMHFSVVPTKTNPPLIRFGLLAVKNMGDNIVRTIIQERKKNGVYKDLENFLTRVQSKDLNKKSLESLIKSGALDRFSERNRLLVHMDQLLTFLKDVYKAHNNGQTSLFDEPSLAAFSRINLKEVIPATDREKLTWEKELVGLYITKHPFSAYEKHFREIIIPINNIEHYTAQAMVIIGGVITKTKKIMTRSNEPMLFVKFEDTSGGTELIVFPSILKINPMIWQEDKMLIVQGKISDKDGESKLLVNRADEVNDENLMDTIRKYQSLGNYQGYNDFNYPGAKTKSEIILCLNLRHNEISIPIKSSTSSMTMENLKGFFERNRGEFKVYLDIFDSRPTKKIETPYFIRFDESIQKKIEDIVGLKYDRVDRIV